MGFWMILKMADDPLTNTSEGMDLVSYGDNDFCGFSCKFRHLVGDENSTFISCTEWRSKRSANDQMEYQYFYNIKSY